MNLNLESINFFINFMIYYLMLFKSIKVVYNLISCYDSFFDQIPFSKAKHMTKKVLGVLAPNLDMKKVQTT